MIDLIQIVGIILVFLFFIAIYFIIKRKLEGKSIKFPLIGLLMTLVVSIGLAVGAFLFVRNLGDVVNLMIEVLTKDDYDLNITEPSSWEASVTVDEVVGLWQLTLQSQEDLNAYKDYEYDYYIIYENGWLDYVYYNHITKRKWKIRNGNYVAQKIDGSMIIHDGKLSIMHYDWGKDIQYFYEKVSDFPKKEKVEKKKPSKNEAYIPEKMFF